MNMQSRKAFGLVFLPALMLAGTALAAPTGTEGPRATAAGELIDAHQALAQQAGVLGKRVKALAERTAVQTRSGANVATRAPGRTRERGASATSVVSRLGGLQRTMRQEHERVSRPGFGSDAKAVAAAQGRLAELQRQLAALVAETENLEKAASIDPRRNSGVSSPAH